MQQTEQLFDHLVSDGEHPGWECDTERPGGLEIDHKLELGRLEYRQVGRLFALQNPPDIATTMAIGVRNIGSVAHESGVASRGKP
jgi:hypothetical protein